MKVIVFLFIVITVVVVLTPIVLVRHVKKQIAEITDMPVSARNGNDNRRISPVTNELTALFAREINEIAAPCEDRLSTIRQTGETNHWPTTSLSHDVRTPLTTLIGYLDATHKGLITGRNRDGYVETTQRRAHDLKEYTDVFFNRSKLNSNEFTLEVRSVETTELARNILTGWTLISGDKQVDYNVDASERSIRIRLDMDNYIRIVSNPIQSAVVHGYADKIGIIPSKRENNMELLLTSNGIRIEKDDLKHIFERLYKCDKGRSKRGSEPGLSVIHQSVGRAGGGITVESFPGEGTELMLLSPLEIQVGSRLYGGNLCHFYRISSCKISAGL